MVNIPLNQEIFTTKEVAGLLKVTDRTVRNWTSGKGVEHRLMAIKCGKILRIARDDLMAFLECCYDQTPQRAKYRTKHSQRKIDKATFEMRQKKAHEQLREFGAKK